jgi:hypothetical protein
LEGLDNLRLGVKPIKRGLDDFLCLDLGGHCPILFELDLLGGRGYGFGLSQRLLFGARRCLGQCHIPCRLVSVCAHKLGVDFAYGIGWFPAQKVAGPLWGWTVGAEGRTIAQGRLGSSLGDDGG